MLLASDPFVRYFGEEYRVMIEDYLKWRHEREPHWNLPAPTDPWEVIGDLVLRAQRIKT